MLLFYNEETLLMYLAWLQDERINVEMYGAAGVWMQLLFDGTSITYVEELARNPHCIILHSEPFYIEEEQ